MLALGSLVFGLSEGGTLGWDSGEILGCFGLAIVAGIVFIRVQLKLKHPLIDLAILKSQDLVLAYYANFIMALVQMATLLLVSLFVQVMFNMNALEAGIRITPLAAGLMASAPVAARLIGKAAPYRVAAVGMGFVTIGMLGMAMQFSGTMNESMVMIVMAIIGIGVGLFMTPNTSSIMSSVSSARRGIANGVRSMMQNMGFVVGTALSLAIVTSRLTPLAKHAVYTGRGTLLNSEQRNLFHSQYHVAFLCLAALACSAMIACLMRRAPTVATATTRAG